MIEELRNIIGQIRYGDKWSEKRLKVCPYFLRWREVQKDIKNAKAYGDWRTVKNLNIQLQWLVSINNHAFDEKVNEIKQEKLSWTIRPSHEVLQQLDTKEIKNQIYLKFEKAHFIVPDIYDIDSTQHQKFALDVTRDYETVIRQTKLEGLPIKEKSLSFPKEFIYKTISFFQLFCTWDKHGVTTDYALELRDRLIEFN